MSFIQSFKAISAKINSIAKDMDEKVDTFAEEVLSIIVDYDEDFFSRAANDVDEDKANMKSAIKKLFDMFKPDEKKKSVNGYIVYCNENREECVRNNAGKKPTEITTILGQQWKALDKEEQKVYNDKAKSVKPLTDDEKKEKAAEKRKEKKSEKPEKKVEKKDTKKKEDKKSESKKEEKKEEKKDSKKKEEKKEVKKDSKKKEEKEEKKSSPPASPQSTSCDYKTVVKYNEDPEFWACKSITMEGKRNRIHKQSGLVLDMEKPILLGSYINKEFKNVNEMDAKIKKWAIKCGIEEKVEEEDIEMDLESELDEE